MRLGRVRRWMRWAPLQRLLRRITIATTAPLAPADRQHLDGLRVLVVGVYLAQRESAIAHLVPRLAESRHLQVDQRWASIGPAHPDAAVRAVTVFEVHERVPKFILVNRLLDGVDLARYDHILLCDDDVFVRRGFLEAYLHRVRQFGLSVAQPARTWNSHFDHEFVLARVWLLARETRFVEIGPVVSFDRAAARLLLPFDESSPMGWGYDAVWPVRLAAEGLRLGIVDGVRVDHSLRPQAVTYAKSDETTVMDAYLAANPHLGREQGQVVLAEHVLRPGWRQRAARLLDADARRA